MAQITSEPRTKEWALAAWQRIQPGIDCVQTFGPDFNPEKPPGEWWCEVFSNSISVGMGWARRFTPGCSIMNYGQAKFPESRGQTKNLGLDDVDLTTRRRKRLHSVADAIFADYPQCRTIISIVYSTNTRVIEIMDAYNRTRLGIIPDGDRQLYLYLVKERESR